MQIDIKKYLSVHLLLHYPQQPEVENWLENLREKLHFINDNDNDHDNTIVPQQSR